MAPDETDTIVAAASARGPGERAVVRLAGPRSVRIAESLTGRELSCGHPRRFSGMSIRVEVDAAERDVPSALMVWPDERSYTRQPAVELHTIGSSPLVDAVVRACLKAGARLAEPGEFTLRACLAGRLDLVQAEAVLAVIDAKHASTLETALAQMAGGLSQPLSTLREELLGLLADLEAGLDFVDEEDVCFIEHNELRDRLAAAVEAIERVRLQVSERRDSSVLPRVALVGPPNVGKSRLYNALVEQFGQRAVGRPALVADQPGVTRDELSAELCVGDFRFELIDTPGASLEAIDQIDAAAQQQSLSQRAAIDLCLQCFPAEEAPPPRDGDNLLVATKVDVWPDAATPRESLRTSAATGEGIPELGHAVVQGLAQREPEAAASGVVASTALRCGESLAVARAALAAASEAARLGVGDELVSFELRRALDGIGRVTGEVVTDDVLDQIFGKFCIGK